jgi:hypothetical protein
MPRTKLFVICMAMAIALLAVGNAYAQAIDPDTYKVDYYANANTAGAPDATVRLDNPGTSGGNLCADIFVFDASEELSECCSCSLSPDDLRTLSVNNDLTSNPGNGVTVTSGVIKIVSSSTAGCPAPTSQSTVSPTPSIRGWVTHIQNSNFTITETASQDAGLSTRELQNLETECYSIHKVDSGKGICSCGTGI